MSDREQRDAERRWRASGDLESRDRARRASARMATDPAHLLVRFLLEGSAAGLPTPRDVRPELVNALARARELARGRALDPIDLLRGALEDRTGRATMIFEALGVRPDVVLAKAELCALTARPGVAEALIEALPGERFAAEPLGTEHLVLALLLVEATSVADGLAGALLKEQGLVYWDTRQQARELLSSLP